MNKPMSVNDTMAKYRRNFYTLYHSTIYPILSQFEKKRKDMLTTLYFICAILLTIVISTGIGMFTGKIFEQSSAFLAIAEVFIGIGALICLVWLPFHFNNKFIDELKMTCMGKILSLFGNVKWHNKTALISDTEMGKSFLFQYYNRRASYDAFSGSYNDVNFEICETDMHYESGSGKNRTVIQIFKGVVIKFNSNKNANGVTVIASKKDAHTGVNNAGIFAGLAGFGLSSLQILPDLFKDGKFDMGLFIYYLIILVVVFAVAFIISKVGKDKNRIVLTEMKLEDPEFSKKYRAYSNDQIQGRYLITTAFMDRFQNLQTTFGTNKAKCSFYGNTLMFAISTNKNLFEIGNLFKRLDDPRQMETFFNELTSIFLFVDYFKLNEKTGL